MKISLPTPSLKQALKLAARAIKTDNSLPILTTIKLETSGTDQLRLTATDNELEIQSVTSCEVQEPGQITVPGKALLEIASALSSDTIKISTDGQHQLTLQAGRSRVKLEGMAPEEFPLLPATRDETGIFLSHGLLREMLSQTVHATAKKSDCRPALTGGCFQLDGYIARLATTDTYRLMVYDLQFDGDTGRKITAVIPQRTMTEMIPLLLPGEEEVVQVLIDDCQIEFRLPWAIVKSRLIAAPFPQIEPVLERAAECVHSMVVIREEFIRALKRIDIIARQELHQIQLRIEDEVTLSAEVPGVGAAEEQLSCIWQDKQMNAWYRSDQLLEMLQVFSGENIMFQFTQADRPLVLRCEDPSCFGILMPLSGPAQ